MRKMQRTSIISLIFNARLHFGILLALLLPSCKDPYKEAMDGGVIFLESIQRPDGAICDSVNPLFETWETVEAATALYAFYQDTTQLSIARALAYLRGQENAAGMLCHNRKCREAYCLETTAEYYILLADIHGPDFIKPRMDTLKRLQRPDGHWEIGNPDVRQDTAFPSVTAFVLGAFAAAEVAPQDRKAAFDWLIAQQDSTGGWGQSWEYYGTEAYALWPCLRAFQGFQSEQIQQCAGRAEARLADLLHSINQNDSVQGDSSGVSKALEIGLMLSTMDDWLAFSNYGNSRSALSQLLQLQRPDGSWNGGLFPIPNARYKKEEYVFATARIVIAFIHYMESQGK